MPIRSVSYGFCVRAVAILTCDGHRILAGGQALEQDAFAGVKFVAGAPLIVERVVVMPGGRDISLKPDGSVAAMLAFRRSAVADLHVLAFDRERHFSPAAVVVDKGKFF